MKMRYKLIITILVFLLGALCVLFFSIHYNKKAALPPIANLLDQNGSAIPAFTELLQIFNIAGNRGPRSLVKEVNYAWASDASKTTIPITIQSYLSYHANSTKKLQSIFKKLGLITPILPNFKESYKNVVIFEGTLKIIYNRLIFLMNMRKQGLQFENVTIVCPSHIKVNDMKELIAYDAGKYLYPFSAKSAQRLPYGQAACETLWNQFKKSPNLASKKANIEAATLPDDSQDFIVDNISYTLPASLLKEDGSLLGISSLPYIEFQKAVLQNKNLKKITLDVVGTGHYDGSIEKIDENLKALTSWLTFEVSQRK